MRKLRKATFYVETINRLNIYTPVNERAWKFAGVLGSNKLTTDDMRTIRANGALPFVRGKNGELKPVRV